MKTLREDLKALKRSDLDKRASEEYGVLNPSGLANKTELIDAIFALNDELVNEIEVVDAKVVTAKVKPVLLQKELLSGFPEYRSDKIVNALEIESVIRSANGSAVFTPKNKNFVPFLVKKSFMLKHRAESGGYLVVYEDGGIGYQGKVRFEDSYSELEE
tara:strand:- start:1806 stop:2282 length:477 start_codon:yes stop_codon:yes gene_type:complete